MGYVDIKAAREKLIQDAIECGYDLSERSDCEYPVIKFLAEMYLFQEVTDDTLNAFRTGEQGDGPLNPNADYGEFFSEALICEFELLTGRRLSHEEWDIFDDEVVGWIKFYADEEKKAAKSAA